MRYYLIALERRGVFIWPLRAAFILSAALVLSIWFANSLGEAGLFWAAFWMAFVLSLPATAVAYSCAHGAVDLLGYLLSEQVAQVKHDARMLQIKAHNDAAREAAQGGALSLSEGGARQGGLEWMDDGEGVR